MLGTAALIRESIPKPPRSGAGSQVPNDTRSARLSGVFINYRREDSGGHAGRLYDRLRQHYGPHRVFRDIDAIAPGGWTTPSGSRQPSAPATL
jgi:hypothetical protein